MKKYLILSLLLALTFSGCRIKDERELVVSVPQMATTEDVAKIRSALSSLKGVYLGKSAFDTVGRKVTVYYDSMVVAHKNIEINIAEAGYDANKIKAIGN